MSRRPVIKARRITAREVKAYEYVQPNPGVRAIAAINGRGSYRKSKKSGSPEARRARARRVLANITKNSRKSSMARSSKRSRRSSRGKLLRNAWREKKSTVTVRRRVAKRHSAAAKLGARRRKLRSNKRRSVGKRRSLRSNKRRSRKSFRANKRSRKTSRRSRKSFRANKRSKRSGRKTARRSRKSFRANKRSRKSSKRSRKSFRANKRSKRSGRKTSRRSRKSFRANRSGGRRRSYKRNGNFGGVAKVVRTGAFVVGGLVLHKGVTGLLKNLLVSSQAAVTDTPATAAAEAGATATSGILPTSLAPYSAAISGFLAAAAGVFAATKLVKKPEDRVLVVGGIVASFLHTLLVTVLKKNASTEKYAGMISGLGSDAKAARLSAMYGFGAAYQAAAGTGEYFSSGFGAAPYEAAAGTGEYFSSGFGSYGGNPDIYEAAAGYGAVETSNSNHILPSADLDRELTIAEAAAGVGASIQPGYQVLNGMGEYFSSGFSGLGNANVGILPTAQTWIPGETNPGIWAGVRPVNEPQSFSAQVAAGVLESGGGQGVFG